MDANAINRMNEDRERAAQRILELEGSLGQTNQVLKRVEARMVAYEASMEEFMQMVKWVVDVAQRAEQLLLTQRIRI